MCTFLFLPLLNRNSFALGHALHAITHNRHTATITTTTHLQLTWQLLNKHACVRPQPVREHLVFKSKPSGLTYVAESKGRNVLHKMGHLVSARADASAPLLFN